METTWANCLKATKSNLSFASALEQGFRSGGWNGALDKGIQVRLAQRKKGYYSAYKIAQLYATWETKIRLSNGSTLLIRKRDFNLIGLNTDFLLDPLRFRSRFAELVRKVGLPQ